MPRQSMHIFCIQVPQSVEHPPSKIRQQHTSKQKQITRQHQLLSNMLLPLCAHTLGTAVSKRAPCCCIVAAAGAGAEKLPCRTVATAGQAPKSVLLSHLVTVAAW